MDEFKQGWKPLIACILGTGCGIIAITLYTQGLFVGPVAEAFGWTEAQFYGGFSILMIAGLITAPIAGQLADKYGARRIGIAGLLGHALGYLLLSVNSGSLVLWYLSFFLLAVFAAGSLPLTWTAIINGWFVKRRGLAIGFTMAGSGLMALIAPPLTEFLISEWGWRWAYRGVGIGALALALPFVLLWLKPGFADQSKQGELSAWGLSRKEAMRTYKFWALGFGFFFMALTISGLVSNFVPILVQSEISRVEAAGLVSIIGLAVIIGRLSVGYLMDWFWAPGITACILIMPIIALLLLVNLTITSTVAGVAAFAIGLVAGATLDLIAFLTSRYYGTRHYGSVFGAMFAFFTVAAGIAPPLFARSNEFAGSYTPILIVSAGVLSITIVLFLTLGKYPEKELVS